MDNYCERVWLNNEKSSSTGSVVAFHDCSGGIGDGSDRHVNTFLEIADCRRKVRLHMNANDTEYDFIKKLRLLAKTVKDFADFLEPEIDD